MRGKLSHMVCRGGKLVTIPLLQSRLAWSSAKLGSYYLYYFKEFFFF